MLKENLVRERAELVKGAAERRVEVKEILGTARDNIKALSAERRAKKEMRLKERAAGLSGAKGETVKLREDARSMLKSFHAARKESGRKLKQDLTASRKARELAVKELHEKSSSGRTNNKKDRERKR